MQERRAGHHHSDDAPRIPPPRPLARPPPVRLAPHRRRRRPLHAVRAAHAARDRPDAAAGRRAQREKAAPGVLRAAVRRGRDALPADVP